MKKIYFILVLFFCSLTLFGQGGYFSFGANYGNYNMSEVKAFQNGVRQSLPVNAKTISSFPAFIGYEGKLAFKIFRFNLGLFGSLNTTGSRLSYEDYSGSYEYNQFARITQLGLSSEFNLSSKKNSPWEPIISMQIGFGKTFFKIDNHTALGTQTIGSDKLVFNSKHVTISPGIGLKRNFAKKLFISTSLCYVFDDAGWLEYNKDKSYHLLDNNNKPISVNWSGIRVGAAFGIKF